MPSRQASAKGWDLASSMASGCRLLVLDHELIIQLQPFLSQLLGTESSTNKPFIYQEFVFVFVFFFRTLRYVSYECIMEYLRSFSFKWLISGLAKEKQICFSILAQSVKNLPTMQETWVQSLGWEPLEKRMAIHSSVLAWKIPWTEGSGGLQSMWVSEDQTL